MNKEEFTELEKILVAKGYQKYGQRWHHEDYVYGKGVGQSRWEEGRRCYHIILSIYDYTLDHSFNYKLSEQERNHVGIEVHVNVSRTIDERAELILPWHDDTTIEEVEKAAGAFYQFVCRQWPEPREWET